MNDKVANRTVVRALTTLQMKRFPIPVLQCAAIEDGRSIVSNLEVYATFETDFGLPDGCYTLDQLKLAYNGFQPKAEFSLDDFPILPEVVEDAGFDYPTRAVQDVMHACSEDSRIHTIRTPYTSNGLIVGTDGKRLAAVETEYNGQPFRLGDPCKLFKYVVQFMGGRVLAQKQRSGGWWLKSSGGEYGVEVYWRCDGQTPPNARNVINDADTPVEIGADVCAQLGDYARTFTKSRGVTLKMMRDGLVLTADGANEVKIHGSYPSETAFSLRFLLEAMTFGGLKFRVASNGIDPASWSENGRKYMLMPVKLS